jgi:hypothetical protein
LTNHDLVDSQLGVLLEDYIYELLPGASTSILATATILTDTVNNATWTAYVGEGGPLVEASDSAAVVVSDSERIYLPFIR